MATTAVRVALRVRPLVDKNIDNKKDDCNITFIKDEPQIIIGHDRSFTFDFVFPPETSQQQLYESSIVPLVDRFTEGKNVTILAYGQTGSGKTYSMGTGIDQASEQGIIPRFAHSLFERMLDFESKGSNHAFQLYASFLELYNEDIHDLLITAELNHQQQHEHPTVREDVDGKIYWAGIREERIYSVEDLMRCLKNGSQKRTTGSTEMNTSSSRSHAIFSIMLKQQITHHDNATSVLAEDNDDITTLIGNRTTLPQRLVSKFHFVDLAGSERLKRTHAMGDRQKEGIFINGGLLALGNVISALGDDSNRKPQHVPYRDSKLTRLLQDSLGGNSHTLMLACVSASSSDYTETLNTLKYANRARNIQNRVQVNQDFVEGGSPEESLYLRLQIARLKNQLHMLKQVHHHDITVQDLKQEMQQIKSFSQQLSHELAEATSVRDTLLLGKDEPVESHPIIQQYAHQIQQLRLQVAETRTSSSSSSKSRDLISLSPKPPSSSWPTASSSMGFLDKNLFVDNNSNITKKHQGSVSSGRRLTSKKKPIVHRMKTQSSPSSKRKQQQQQAHDNMDELFELLRKEYNATCEQFKSTDETVLHASHANTERATTASTPTGTTTTTATTTANPMRDNVCEAEDNKTVFPDTQSHQHFSMPADICPPNSTFEDDELEALAVPSWSDAPKLPSINGSIKRKSISLDSMWDDTDSSMTTSRVDNQSPTQQHHHHSQNHHHQKEMRRSSKNLLKMLHQIQADLLVKRELVGQLERSEDQYTQMRVNYESRLNELKDHLLEIQNQRDAALRQSGTSIVASPPQQLPKRPQSVLQLRENRQAQEVRSQYEQKIKRLIQENAELRKKTTQSTQSIQTARAKAEGTVGRLRADIETLKLDKKQLHKSLKLEADKAREASVNHEREMAQLKRRVLVAFDAKKKLEDTNQAQQQVITKRNQETLAANMQLRHLTTVLRRAANEGTFLNEAALERLLAEASASAATAIQSSTASNNNSKPAAAGRSRMHSPTTTGL